MSVDAFVDHGFPSGRDFFSHFLLSPDFNLVALRKLVPPASSNLKKEDIVRYITLAYERGKITDEEILLEYVKQPRKWLSFKQGVRIIPPKIKSPLLLLNELGEEVYYEQITEQSSFKQVKSPQSLLNEFGEEGWYGPITELNSSKQWYIRTHRVIHYDYIGIGDAGKVDERRIRWTTIAEVGVNYIALSWNGFTFKQLTEGRVDPQSQFPYWNYIPQFFDELTEHIKGTWRYPNLHQLVLQDLWDKYLNKNLDGFSYIWQHLRIRAEASGVALNAHSSGVAEIHTQGLKALSRKLAGSALEALGFPDASEKITNVENSLLRTMIHEWGTKSYEFKLEREVNSKDFDLESLKKSRKPESVFRAHCYFGLKPDSTSQDSLPHLKCYTYCGGSLEALKFLLAELKL
jgi:hypothetical protein